MAKQINDLNKSLEEQLRLNEKQEKTDNNLKTTDKTIVGAINELFQNVDSGKNIIADAIDVNGITGNSTFSAMGEAIEGKNTEINNLKTELAGKVTPAGTAVAANVLTGKTFINSSGTLQTGGMLTIDSNMVGWGGNSNNHWMTGEVQVTDASGIGNPCVYFAVPRNHCTNIDFVMSSTPDLRPENIVSGKNILGVVGTATVSNANVCFIYNLGNDYLTGGWYIYSQQQNASLSMPATAGCLTFKNTTPSEYYCYGEYRTVNYIDMSKYNRLYLLYTSVRMHYVTTSDGTVNNYEASSGLGLKVIDISNVKSSVQLGFNIGYTHNNSSLQISKIWMEV